MTNIAIKLPEDKSASIPVKILKDLAGCCGISLTQLKEDANNQRPILNVELFMNDHVEIAQTIRSIMSLDRENNLGLIYFEMQHQELPDESEKIDMEIMENTLSEADGEFS